MSSFAVHPGTVATELSSHIEAWFPTLWNQTGGEFRAGVVRQGCDWYS